jgi:hypothetical protein
VAFFFTNERRCAHRVTTAIANTARRKTPIAWVEKLRTKNRCPRQLLQAMRIVLPNARGDSRCINVEEAAAHGSA